MARVREGFVRAAGGSGVGAVAQLGLSTEFRVTYDLALAVLVAVGMLVVAVVLLWRKFDDGLALFVSCGAPGLEHSAPVAQVGTGRSLSSCRMPRV